MRNSNTKQEPKTVERIGCEEQDIAYTMSEEAAFSRNWINDCLLRQYVRKTGEKRLCANTRKLIKMQSYNEYIRLSSRLRRSLEAKAQNLRDEIKHI